MYFTNPDLLPFIILTEVSTLGLLLIVNLLPLVPPLHPIVNYFINQQKWCIGFNFVT
ncbi:MAG: hypothetical protein IPN49_05150 [Saprospiraceae bacterium]|nr:hypothetical protein [Saprospiraceae bacterium]